MIGNAWPVGDTGYSVLEWGDLDRQSFCLRITAWVVVDPRGEQQPGFHATRAAAEAAVQALLAGASKPACS